MIAHSSICAAAAGLLMDLRYIFIIHGQPLKFQLKMSEFDNEASGEFEMLNGRKHHSSHDCSLV